ncbi:MAG TPA: FAD-dependent oxidoreductase [Chloroflexota bacterium]
MTHTPRVAVVGAGVVGLATTSALLDAGADVRLYERHEPGLGQSNGRTRVFRLAHGDARLVDLAARAERLWRAWETRFRRRLVGHEGLIVTGGDTVATWTAAMADAGAPHMVLSIEEATSRVPVARPAGSAALFDPAAGPTRARRTVECLLAACAASLRLEEVVEIGHTAIVCTVSTSSGSWECDEVIIAAGAETPQLAAAAGIGVEIPIVHDSRFTYSIRDEYRDGPLACWFDQSGVYGPGFTSYGQRVGSTDFYAVGIGWGDASNLSSDEELALHRQKALEYMPEAYPGLDPVPMSEIQCSTAVSGLRHDGDGFMARRSGGVTALYGNNLFKFAPLLGQLLCQTALTGVLPDELHWSNGPRTT